MRSSSWFKGALSLAVGCALTAACSGSSSTDLAAHPSIASGDSGTSSSGSGGVNDSAADAPASPDAADAGPVADACVVPDAGDTLPRDPAANSCGTDKCQYSTSYCCAPRDATAPACAPSPYGSDTSACTTAGKLPISCDEKAKCQHSTVCCGVRSSPSQLDAVKCVEKVQCLDPDVIVCGSDADCLVGQQCVATVVYGTTLGFCATRQCGG